MIEHSIWLYIFLNSVSSKLLIAMDFDHTIIDQNTVSFMKFMVPDEMVPKTTKAMYLASLSWIPTVQSFYKVVNDLKITEEIIRSLISDIPPITGMDSLMSVLHGCRHDIIIISNSNTVIVDQWLEAKALKGTVTEVFTNPSWFDEAGLLNIQAYQNQTTCRMSPRNLCKRQVLQNYVMFQASRGFDYEGIVYIGDGKNDLCAVKWMDFDDVVMPRKGFPLNQLLHKKRPIVRAQTLPWTTGTDILKNLLRRFPFSFNQCNDP